MNFKKLIKLISAVYQIINIKLKNILIILFVIIPLYLLGEEPANKKFIIKFSPVEFFDHNKRMEFSTANLYVGSYIKENIVLGITNINSMSGNDSDRYIPLYKLSNYQLFSLIFFKEINEFSTPFLFIKRSLKFETEEFNIENLDGNLERIRHDFDLLDDLKIGVGIKNKIYDGLYFDLTYYQLIKENNSGFKNGLTQLGLVIDF